MTDKVMEMALDTESMLTIAGIAVTIVIAVVGGIYAVVTNTKKYELTENYRQEILHWYTEVVSLMMQIIHYCEKGLFSLDEFKKQKIDMLSRLSALIETGRFYFPNVIKNDGFGGKKPTAYQGYRHINLEFMMHFYRIASHDSIDESDLTQLWALVRHFTSVIFDMIEPRKRNRRYLKYLELTIPEGKSIEDFIAQDLQNSSLFYK